MTESFAKNFIDYEEYPQSADIQNRCVSMIGRLFHAPTTGDPHTGPVGTSCVGSSEAIMLAVLAMKKRWKNRRIQEGKPYDNPNIVMSSAVQVCWEKAARYFEVEEKYVYCTPDRYVLDPEETVNLVDENTIGICAILGTTYTGEYEDVKAVNDLLTQKGLHTPIHVDAASGGFVAPFVVPDLEWDFRLEHVVSINVSGHKYGLVYPGVGWVVWRSAEYLPKELVFNINYLGADQASFTLNFSKGASQVIGQYYQLIRLGKHGYRAIMSNLTRTANYLSDSLEALGFIIMSKKAGEGLPLVAFRLPPKEDRNYDEFALAHQLRVRGWVVPAYTMAPHTENLKMLRVVVREDFTRNRCDALINDIRLGQTLLQEMDRESIKRQQEFIHKHHTASGKATHNHPKYRVRSCGTLLCPLNSSSPKISRLFCYTDRVHRRRNIPSRARLARRMRSASPATGSGANTNGWSTPTINASLESTASDSESNSGSAFEDAVDVPTSVAASTTIHRTHSSTSMHKPKVLRRNRPASTASKCLSLELPGGQKLLTVRIWCA